MIALIDYGAGNLTSVRKALAHLGVTVTTPTAPSDGGLPPGRVDAVTSENAHPTEAGCAYQIAGGAFRFRHQT